MALDAVGVFLNDDEFAEEITYTPYGGTPRTIKAIVVRERLGTNPEDSGRTLRNECEIFIANHATSGVTSVDKGDDSVSFPEQIGGSAINWFIMDIISKDDGMWHLKVGK